MDNRKINFSTVFAGQDVGIGEVADSIWLVSFMDYDLGYFDENLAGLAHQRVEPGPNPFVPEMETMSPVLSVKDVSGIFPENAKSAGKFSNFVTIM